MDSRKDLVLSLIIVVLFFVVVLAYGNIVAVLAPCTDMASTKCL